MARRPTPIADALLRDRPIAKAIVEGLRNAAADPAAAITTTQVDAAAVEHVATAIETTPGVAVVPVKSGWFSKINWTQLGGVLLSGLEIALTNLPPATLLVMVGGNQLAAAILTFVLKTWFTRTVTPQSAAKP